MKIRIAAIAMLAAVVTAAGLGRIAEARNANCSGGILYVSQALSARNNKDIPESKKLMLKAVEKLSTCATEDPNDFEALGYLGWAYAEVDSFRPAGIYFEKSIQGLATKGDKKKLDWASDNRKSFYVNELNAGIRSIQEAQAKYDFGQAPKDDAAKAQQAEAMKTADAALGHLENALLIVPEGDTLSVAAIKNIAFVYLITGRRAEAAQYYTRAQKIAPNDKTIAEALNALRNDTAYETLKTDVDKAITMFQQGVKDDPSNPSRHGALADALFERAQKNKDEAKAKADYKAAGDEYAKAFSLSGKDPSLAFNAGIAYQNAKEYALAEPMWKGAVALQPDNLQAVGNYAVTLNQLKKYDEASKAVQPALEKSAKDPEFRRLLTVAYATAGNSDKASQEQFVYKALSSGKEVPDGATIAKAAPAASGAGKTFATMGAPDQIYEWEAQSQKVQTWFYWSKKTAYHFSNNTLAIESNWNNVDFKPAAK